MDKLKGCSALVDLIVWVVYSFKFPLNLFFLQCRPHSLLPYRIYNVSIMFGERIDRSSSKISVFCPVLATRAGVPSDIQWTISMASIYLNFEQLAILIFLVLAQDFGRANSQMKDLSSRRSCSRFGTSEDDSIPVFSPLSLVLTLYQ